jgi:hypothetical protein
MKQMLASLGLWVGAGIAILTLVDWILTESQKKRLTGWGETAWLWLDDQRTGKFLEFLKRKPYQVAASIVLTVIFLAAAIAGVLALLPQIADKAVTVVIVLYCVGLALSMIFVAWKVHPRVAYWIIRSPSLVKFFGRSFMLSAAGVLLTMLIEYLMEIVGHTFDPGQGRRYFIIVAVVSFVAAALRLETGLVAAMLVLSVIWLVVVLVIMAVFAVIKFLLLRIVEYPKGPVLGLTGLLLAIAAIIKIFVK